MDTIEDIGQILADKRAQEKTIPTPAEQLAKIESAAFEILRSLDAGTSNPMSQRMSDSECVACLRALGFDLGYRYAGCRLSEYEVYAEPQKTVVERLKAFAPKIREECSDGGGLILYGPPGTGKDHLLSALLKVAIQGHKLSVKWYDGQKLFEEARNAISQDREHDFRVKLTNPQILALSDPQPPKGELSDYQCSIIRDVIDRRYRRGLSTWITTNLGTKETAEGILTAPVMDRLREKSLQLECNWPSYRSRK
jgi:DNA replication protein DnaC